MNNAFCPDLGNHAIQIYGEPFLGSKPFNSAFFSIGILKCKNRNKITGKPCKNDMEVNEFLKNT